MTWVSKMYVPKQYDSAKLFTQQYTDLGNIPDEMDQQRCAAYALYDDFYHNRPETFEVTLRGSSDTEIYVPSSKKIIRSTSRFLAPDPEVRVQGGNAAEVKKLLDGIWKREEVDRKFVRSKRELLRQGDFIWYLTADRSKQAGKRISINAVHPSSYFPITDPNNTNRVIGCHLVDLVPDPREPSNTNKVVARRQTYRDTEFGIISECRTFELGKWDDRIYKENELKPVSIVSEAQVLQGISRIPLYHTAIDTPTGSLFGLSVLSGIEYVINAINQSMTYEDLTLVLQGLGVYVTSAGPPRDPVTNQPVPYQLHPGNVVEVPQDADFQRVTGVSSISPYQDHIKSLDNWMLDGAGLSDIATGSVDVAVAQSGIALAFKMGPILAENKDRQLEIKARWDQMLYDLATEWFPTFEGVQPGDGLEIELQYGDPMPVDRTALTSEVVLLLTNNLITTEEAREKLETIGYENSAGIVDKILEDIKKRNDALNPDPYAAETNSGTGALNEFDQFGSSISSGVNGNAPAGAKQ